MDPLTVIELAREAILVLLKLSLPVLGVALLVGLLISLLQALTQIQEQTIVFVPKLLAVFITLFSIGPYMGRIMSIFTTQLFSAIITLN